MINHWVAPEEVKAEYHKFGIKNKKVSPESGNFYIKLTIEWIKLIF